MPGTFHRGSDRPDSTPGALTGQLGALGVSLGLSQHHFPPVQDGPAMAGRAERGSAADGARFAEQWPLLSAEGSSGPLCSCRHHHRGVGGQTGTCVSAQSLRSGCVVGVKVASASVSLDWTLSGDRGCAIGSLFSVPRPRLSESGRSVKLRGTQRSFPTFYHTCALLLKLDFYLPLV